MTTDENEQRQVDILIVGAGLVGSLAALFLARRGFQVDVFERRPDMRKVGISAGRSINLNISCRGLEALRRIGLEDDVLPELIPMMGRMMHGRDGALTYQPYGKDDTEYGNSVSRGGLNKLLMDKAEATGQVRFHFNMKAEEIDFDRNSIRFVSEDKPIDIRAAVIFATDGAASNVRQKMMKLDGFQSSVEALDYGYKELYIAPALDGGFRIEKNALHIWPRGTYMLIALPNLDGSFTVTLFLPYKGEISFEKLTTEQAVRDFFTEHFLDATELMPDFVEAFMNNPTGHMETVKCSPWHVGGQCVLMGDAAHGIVPFFGQGMNCGFEDLTIFDECVEDHINNGGTIFVERRSSQREDERRNYGKLLHDGEANWQRVFADFFVRRQDNCDAIADMAVENFIEMRDKVGDPKFLLAKAVEKILEKKFPGKYISRYSLVTFSNVPYRLAQQAGTICDGILAELVSGIERAEDVDLVNAERLIDQQLAPLLIDRPELKREIRA